MKLLLDENISHKIVASIKEFFPGSSHVRFARMLSIEDEFIFEYAREKEFDAIVTFDEDYRNMSLVKGSPPKIIWLRTGNTTTENLIKILIDKREDILAFLTSVEFNEYTCLEID